jgi:hypothetical protein
MRESLAPALGRLRVVPNERLAGTAADARIRGRAGAEPRRGSPTRTSPAWPVALEADVVRGLAAVTAQHRDRAPPLRSRRSADHQIGTANFPGMPDMLRDPRTCFVILPALIGTLATQATPTREQETISLSMHERQHCLG